GIYTFGVLSDRYRQHQRSFLLLTLSIAAIGLAGAGFVTKLHFSSALVSAGVSITLISVAAIGIYGTKAPFWPMPSLFLTGSAAAGGIAFINAIGNLGGFIGPY